jgi:hypothetical protein
MLGALRMHQTVELVAHAAADLLGLQLIGLQ